MNISLQTNNFNSQYNARRSNASFGKSPFLEPLKRVADKSTDAIAKHYTSKLYQSGITGWLAKRVDNLNSVVDHIQVVGSAIISGMYMEQTLTNKNLDPEKRKTLAVNQFLTFAVSTLLSYVLDKKLDTKWEQLTRKYAVANLEQKAMENMTKEERKAHKKAKFEELNKAIEEWNKAENAKFDAKVRIGEISADSKYTNKTVADYISKKMSNPELTKQIKGMGVLKKLFIFGTIYRFISPVAVTPLANWIGDAFIYKGDEKK